MLNISLKFGPLQKPPKSTKQKYRSHGSLKVAGWRVKPLVTVADLLHTLSLRHCVCSYPTLPSENLQGIYSTSQKQGVSAFLIQDGTDGKENLFRELRGCTLSVKFLWSTARTSLSLWLGVMMHNDTHAFALLLSRCPTPCIFLLFIDSFPLLPQWH